MGFLFSTNSHALNTQFFHPLIGQPNQGITVNGSEGLRKGNAQLGVYVNLTDDPLEFSLPPDNRVDGIVDAFLTTDFLFSYGLTNWFTFHFGLPFNPYSSVEPIANFTSTEDTSLGDLRFSGTLNLYKTFDQVDSSIQRSGFALIPFLTIPMNNKDDFFGDASWTAGGLLAMDRHLGKRHYVALNLGARFRETERLLNLVVAHEFITSFAYVNRLSCKSKWDLVAEAQGTTTFRKFYSEEITSPVELLLGLRKQSQSQHWEWSVGGGRGINNGYGAPDFRLYTGLSYLFFDKNKPSKHCCEAKAPPVAVVEEPKPEQKLGSLHVEVVNSNGEAVVSSMQIKRSEVLVVENVTNRIKQPIEVGEYQVILPDQNITEAVQVVADQETYKKIVIPVAAPIQAETIVRYIEPIYFDSNKDTIKPESYKALDDVYSIILEFPNIENLQIEAHTDSQGKDAYNLDLSNRRAQAAKEYLVRKGVGKAQIKTMGFGEVRPIAPNETVEGRAKNRRVEFLIQAPNQNVKILQKAQ